MHAADLQIKLFGDDKLASLVLGQAKSLFCSIASESDSSVDMDTKDFLGRLNLLTESALVQPGGGFMLKVREASFKEGALTIQPVLEGFGAPFGKRLGLDDVDLHSEIKRCELRNWRDGNSAELRLGQRSSPNQRRPQQH